MPVERVIPARALPPLTGAKLPRRIIVHWTAGSYNPTTHDLACYHWLIDGTGHAIRGKYPIGQYGPPNHTRMLNTGSVGLSMCAMGGARERPFQAGQWPLNVLQWERCAQAAAEILHAYALPLSERTCLMHSEAWRVYRRPQLGKWDVNVVPFQRDLPPAEVHALFRRKVAWYLDRLEEE